MKATTAKKSKACVAKRASERGIQFDEMRRLMRVYGSLKCLRRRSPGGEANMKDDSIRRKFYRWFPDLEERFARDDAGYYRPKYGHEFEMRYREEMRRKDAEVLAQKRARCRQQRLDGADSTSPPRTITEQAEISFVVTDTSTSTSSYCSPVSPAICRNVPLSPCNNYQEATRDDIEETRDDINLELDNERTASASIIADTEPVDRFFVAEHGIFDEVEKNFFGDIVPDCPSIEPSSYSSSSGEQCSSASSWESDSPSIDNMLEKSMKEYCEEILVSDRDGSATEFHFGML